ncbi:MAG: leucine-rich repeat domain-containing protein [Promethearchaeota archaeon]
MKEYKINEFITLKLENSLTTQQGIVGSLLGWVAKNVFIPIQDYKTYIYINGKRFQQCRFLLLDIPIDKMEVQEQIDSIDEASEILNHSLEFLDGRFLNITPDTEFWAHCSNLQAWVENDYDTRLLHSNLAFPLLKKLSEAGDPIAKNVFKDEIVKRFTSGHLNVMKYLINEGFMEHFTRDETDIILEEVEKKSVQCVSYRDKICGIVDNNTLDLSKRGIISIEKIEGLKDLTNLIELDISHNRIKEIKGLENLINLESLNLSNNLIREIKGLGSLHQLDKLNLWFNPIQFSQLILLFQNPKEVVNYCHKSTL